MSTTPNRLSLPSSKYLSPCRTFGLKRKCTPKSSPSTLSLSPEGVCLKPSGKKLKSKSCESQLPEAVLIQSPLTSKTFENKLNKMISLRKDCLKSKLKDNNGQRCLKETKFSDTHSSEVETNVENLENNIVTPDMLKDLIMKVNKKSARLEGLVTNQVYTKKHDFECLKKSTEKWKATCKEALNALMSETQRGGQTYNMLDIMAEHHITPELLDFDSETMEFL